MDLSETDLKTTGGGAVFTTEMINADVNGAPAVILSVQGSEKKSFTTLSWFSDGMLYLVRTPGVESFLALYAYRYGSLTMVRFGVGSGRAL